MRFQSWVFAHSEVITENMHPIMYSFPVYWLFSQRSASTEFVCEL